ncbi:MAG: pyridoxal phosphate-dependent aminotransferase [Bryobacteraceae bacterium]
MYSYSERLSWSFSHNSFSRLVENRRKAGVPLIDLTVSNPTETFRDYPHAAIGCAYANIKDFAYRPDPLGARESRVAVARYYEKRKISISPDHILLTASTSEAYSLLFKLFCNSGDEILVPVPSYPLLEYLAALESARIVPYRLIYDGSWYIDFGHLRRQISPRTRAVVVVNPNNPTGSFLKRCEAEPLLNIAQEHSLPIISDEVFMDYSFGAGADRVKTLIGHDSALSFSLHGLSKAAGMPQMKVAWIAVNGPQQHRETARERLELLLDTYLSVATPVQRALPELLHIGEGTQRQIQLRTAQNVRALHNLLQDSPACCLHCEGGWSAIIQLPRRLPEEEWITRLLNEQHVIVQPGYFFDMASEAYVVVSLITPADEFAEGIHRLRHLSLNV